MKCTQTQDYYTLFLSPISLIYKETPHMHG